MNDRFGMLRISTVSPAVRVGNPEANAKAIIAAVKDLPDSDIVLTPELSVTGYTCGDLFAQDALIEAAWTCLMSIAAAFDDRMQLLVVGVPVRVNGSLYNCAAVLNQGYLLGLVPKSYLPNYKEFYEVRWFKAADGTEPREAIVQLEVGSVRPVPFGTDLLFRCVDVVVGIEICEDLWVPLPPSSFQAVAGANVLLNLSASNETVGKSDYRRKLIEQQSARCIAAYVYCSCGPTESTSDLVFGGHSMICENGLKLAETDKFVRPTHRQTVDVDVQRLNSERARATTFGDCRRVLPREYRFEDFYINSTYNDAAPLRANFAQVFIPVGKVELERRCNEIFSIQTCGLAKRLESIQKGDEPVKVHIGVSGGLDSTLALLVCAKTYDMLGWDRSNIRAVTMPGFGTTNKTFVNAKKLMELLGVWQETIDIRPLAIAAFDTIGHKPFGINYDNGHPEKTLLDDFCNELKKLPREAKDLVFENVQARIRTLVLMSGGFVVGTGDLSESALGWCTYNGDHMSMYNPNASVPKTLVRFLVDWIARWRAATLMKGQEFGPLVDVLLDISTQVISPELLPGGGQDSEEAVGPYELVDYFLFHFLRNNFSPDKIAWMAQHAAGFTVKYGKEDIAKWLKLFLKRFFAAQFKRNCVPDGPKVGSVALSPRGDWRMPSDADASLWTKGE